MNKYTIRLSIIITNKKSCPINVTPALQTLLIPAIRYPRLPLHQPATWFLVTEISEKAMVFRWSFEFYEYKESRKEQLMNLAHGSKKFIFLVAGSTKTPADKITKHLHGCVMETGGERELIFYRSTLLVSSSNSFPSYLRSTREQFSLLDKTRSLSTYTAQYKHIVHTCNLNLNLEITLK